MIGRARLFPTTLVTALGATLLLSDAKADEVAKRTPPAAAPSCADPAAVSLKTENIVSQTQGEMSTYSFRLVGTVQNLGIVDYKPAGGMTAVLTFGTKQLATVDLPALAAGLSTDLRGQVSNWSPDEDAGDFALALRGVDAGDCVPADNALTIAGPDLERTLRGK